MRIMEGELEATKGSELRVRGISSWFNTYEPYKNPRVTGLLSPPVPPKH